MEGRGDDGFLASAADRRREKWDSDEAQALRERMKHEMRLSNTPEAVSYTHLRAHETRRHL
eukprot:4788499-Prorocentrum_lima.AAC.1